MLSLGTASASASTILTASADTYVDSTQPTASFGTANPLLVRGGSGGSIYSSPAARALLEFDVPSSTPPPSSLALRVWSASAAAQNLQVRTLEAGCAWQYNTVTWNTRPDVIDPPVASLASVASGWNSIQLPLSVLNPSTCLALTTTGPGTLSIDSLSGANPAQVVLTAAAPLAAPTPTATPTLTDRSSPGRFRQGDVLSTTPGLWTNSPTAYAYQWQMCDSGGSNCANASGSPSNRSTYTIAAGDIGRTIRAVVTATNTSGSGSATSAPSTLVSRMTGNVYYIAPAGSDSAPCSLASPCKTIAHASPLLHPGDTLYARGGTYTGQAGITWAAPTGTSSAPITFSNFPGETPVFDGQGVVSNFMNIVQVSYTTFTGLTIEHYHGCCAALWLGFSGSGTVYATHDTLANNTITDIGDPVRYPATSHGIYVSYGTEYIALYGNTITRTSGNGISVYRHGSQYVNDHIVIYNNVIDQQDWGNWGIVLRDSAYDEVYNNTVINAIPYNTQGGADIDYSGSTNVTFRDNIVSLPLEGSGATCDHNMFIHDVNGGTTLPNCGASNVAAASGGFANAGDFHLTASSPAIGAGVAVPYATTDKDGNARPQRTSWDIGAYEYVAPPA
jgi:Right handed beta helix region